MTIAYDQELDGQGALAHDLGMRMIACDISRELLNIRDDELFDILKTGGAATFLGDAARANDTLFI